MNLFIVFFLTGLWHGASWTFVIWGIYHGIFIIIERLGFEKILNKHNFFSWVYCILLVDFGWVFFRVDDIKASFKYIIRMILPWKYTQSNYSIFEFVTVKMLVIILLGILGSGIIRWFGKKMKIDDKWKYSYFEILYCSILLLLSLLSLASGTYNPFIYFRF